MGVGEASTGNPIAKARDAALIADLKRFSIITVAKRQLAWLAMDLVKNGIPGDSPAIVKLREAYTALLAMETKPVTR